MTAEKGSKLQPTNNDLSSQTDLPGPIEIAFQNTEQANEYLTSTLSNFDSVCLDPYEREKLKAAIAILLHSRTEQKRNNLVVNKSLSMDLRQFVGENPEYSWDAIDFENHEMKEIKETTAALKINKQVGMGPETVQDTVSETKRFGPLKRSKRQLITRPATPEEQIYPIFEEVADLYFKKTYIDGWHSNSYTFSSSAERDKHWVLVVNEAEYEQEAKELAKRLAESFPNILIELKLNLQRKKKKE